MINWKPNFNADDIKTWLICESVDRNVDYRNIKKNEDGSYQVFFSIGGVELDFNKVANRINEMIARKAYDLLKQEYSDLIYAIQDIQERIEEHKEKFKYDWEEC